MKVGASFAAGSFMNKIAATSRLNTLTTTDKGSPGLDDKLAAAADRLDSLNRTVRLDDDPTDPLDHEFETRGGVDEEAASALLEKFEGNSAGNSNDTSEVSSMIAGQFARDEIDLDMRGEGLPQTLDEYWESRDAQRSAMLDDAQHAAPEHGGSGGTPTTAGLSDFGDSAIAFIKAVVAAVLPGPAGVAASVGLDSNADTIRGVAGLVRQGEGGTSNSNEHAQMKELERNGFQDQLEPNDGDILEAYVAHLVGTPFDPNASKRRMESHDPANPSPETSNPNPLAEAHESSTNGISIAAQLTGPQDPERTSPEEIRGEGEARIGDFTPSRDPRKIYPNPNDDATLEPGRRGPIPV